MTMKNLLLIAVTMVVGITSTNEAFADGRRLNSLPEDVAVRHRRLYVKQRFEATPLFESSIAADYQHTVGPGLKLEYHMSDMLSFGVVGVYGLAFHTGLVDKILDTLPPSPMAGSRDPSKTQFTDHLNTMPVHGAAYVSVTPWYGKLAAFSQAYVGFDFYFQAGLSFASLTSSCPTSVCDDPNPGRPITNPDGSMSPPLYNPNRDAPLNNGQRVGLYLGGGIHVFLSDFLALDLTVRDYAFSDNPSGADYNADGFVGPQPPMSANPGLGDDNRFLHHLFFGAGISLLFPTAIKRTP
jgi:outer membrane beta-barrel protein